MALQLSAMKPAVSRVQPLRPPVTALGRIRKIALLGSHHSLEFAPWEDPSWELWGHSSSRHFYLRQPERYFDLHPKACWIMAHKQDRYMRWLKKNTVPIYMQDVDKDVPASIRYPKERILAEFRPYFTSHAAWMIALALTEGVTHLAMYGVNYSADSEYRTQRGSTEYWLGLAEGRGVHIIIPPRCTLLKDPPELYGYESHDEKGKLRPSYKPHKLTVQTAEGPKELTIVEPGTKTPPQIPPPHITPEMMEAERRLFVKNFPELVGV